jgi:hypothetical protein
MNENLKNQEALKNLSESLKGHEATAKTPEVDKAKLEKEASRAIEKARDSAEQHAAPSKLLASEKDAAKSFYTGTHNALKKETYQHLLMSVRQKLPKSSRSFSRIIHQKNIEAISEVGAKTVARPSGLLGGGLGALIGSIVLLRYSSYYGFEYNYSFILFTFLGGFSIGLIIEIILRAFKKK